ncbi:MAG: ATP-dependent Clp protease proteolytic subunit [Candidatus Taylorbacteria bacterium]|nr:ATP-dependent Clp protease proteolytic subunit [Candidatus Taylorbacteria bacterium]
MNIQVTSPPIKLEGHLTTPVLQKFATELRKRLAEDTETVLIEINSSGGNALQSKILFEEFIPYENRIVCRIFRAYSAAALLALLGHKRLIYHESSFGIHLGAITLESSELLSIEALEIAVKRILLFRKFFIETLEKRTNLPNSVWTTLSARNKIVLDAKKCLEYGVVQEIL